jgi:ABC-type Co2+ transport system permease subunit
MSRQRTVQLSLAFFLLAVLVVPLPAFAYGDPTGGLLFQTLTPLLAILWGAWMIFANSVRKGVRRAILRIRGIAPEDASANDTGKAGGAD